MVRHMDRFQKALQAAEQSIHNKESDFVFVAQKPRFANQNVGWIHKGEKVNEINGVTMYEFKKLKYRPKLSQAEDFFEDTSYDWNLGYFVTTPRYLTGLFKRFVPEMAEQLMKIADVKGSAEFDEVQEK